MALLSFWQTQCEMLRLYQKTSNDPKQWQEKSVVELQKRVHALRSLPKEEALAILEVTTSAKFDDEERAKVAEIVMAKAMETPALGGASQDHTRSKLQVVESFENYLTQADWEALLSSRLVPREKVLVLARRAHCVGIVHPTEVSVRNIVSIKTVSSGEGVQGQQALEDLREFKKILKGLGAPMVMGPSRYPTDPMLLKGEQPNLWEVGYSDVAGPIPSQISKSDLTHQQRVAPCRSTKVTVGSMGPKESGFQPQPPMPQQWLQALAQSLVFPGVASLPTHTMPPRVAAPPLQLTFPGEAQVVQVPPRPLSWSFPSLLDAPMAGPEATHKEASEGSTQVASAGLEPLGVAGPTKGAVVAPPIGLDALIESVKDVTEKKAAKQLTDSSGELPSTPKPKKCLKRPAAAMSTKNGSVASPTGLDDATLTKQGWSVKHNTRMSGSQQGTKYTVWWTPEGEQLRSKAQVQRYLGFA